MLLSAAVLAEYSPGILSQHAFTKYVFLYGDALLLWVRRWRKQVRRSGTPLRAPSVDDLAAALRAAEGVRDILAAKRQPAAAWRPDDMEQTAALWEAASPANAAAVVDATLRSWQELTGEDPAESLLPLVVLHPADAATCAAALPTRDGAYWHLAADTAADLRPYTLPAAQGGEIGRRIAQINDVVLHLDVLLSLAPVLYGRPPHDWFVRSALILELHSLLELTVGPPPGHFGSVTFPLRDLCRRFEASDAASELDRLTQSIGSGWDYLRWARNKIAAHVDDELPVGHLHDHLIQLDYRGIVRLAEHVLNWLDGLGCRLELKLLAIGERRIRSWPTDATSAPPGRPNSPILRGALARLFRTVDSPFMIGCGTSLGSAIVAGITSGRKPQPRQPTAIPRRWDPRFEPRRVPLPTRRATHPRKGADTTS